MNLQKFMPIILTVAVLVMAGMAMTVWMMR